MSEAPVVPGADDAAEPEVVVVTGMSGAGRSTVGNVMEDHGWYVIDNLPVTLLPDLLRLSAEQAQDLAAHGSPVRVGIVSGFLFQHSVWKIGTRGWVTQLDPQRFQVFGDTTT